MTCLTGVGTKETHKMNLWKTSVRVWACIILLTVVCFIVVSCEPVPELPLPPTSMDWSSVDRALEAGVADHTFPGCVAIVATEKVRTWGDGDDVDLNRNNGLCRAKLLKGVQYIRAVGNYTYGAIPPNDPTNPRMAMHVRYDSIKITIVITSTCLWLRFNRRCSTWQA